MDPGLRQLRRRGIRVPLAPKPFDLLALLVSRAERLVTREEIHHHLWGEDTHVEAAAGIHAYVGQVRAALEDRATAPRYIETVPRHGYCFVAPVEVIRPEDSSKTADTALRSGPFRPGTTRRFIRLAAVGILALVILLVAGWLSRRPSATPVENPRLLVTPFRAAGDDSETLLLADGLTEELIRELIEGYRGDVAVIAPTSALRLRPRAARGREEIPHPEADYQLTGRVTLTPGTVRLQVRLTDSRRGEVLWSTGYDRPRRSLLRLQSEVAAKVARSLSLHLPAEGRALTTSGRGDRHEAWEACLLGRALLHRARLSAEPAEFNRLLGAARAYFEEALAMDPTLPRGWVGLAEVRLLLSPTEATLEQVVEALETALALDGHHAEAHLRRANAYLFQQWNPAAARHHLAQAEAMAPGTAALHQTRAFVHLANGDLSQARAALDRALVLDPLSPWVQSDLGWLLYYSGRFRDAVRECGRWPHLLGPQECRLRAAWMAGDLSSAAVAARQRMLRFGGDRIDAEALERESDAVVMRRYWRGTAAFLAGQRPPRPSGEAAAWMALGQRRAALDALERAFEEGEGWNLPFLHLDPLFAPLQDEPRFERLLLRLHRLNSDPGLAS